MELFQRQILAGARKCSKGPARAAALDMQVRGECGSSERGIRELVSSEHDSLGHSQNLGSPCHLVTRWIPMCRDKRGQCLTIADLLSKYNN